jgi:hypothetical protein
MSSKPVPKTPSSLLANPDPWARFARGAEMARCIERGREQEALWLFDDGVRPPVELLSRALGCAAYQGLERLCWRLIALGASVSRPSIPSASMSDEWSVSTGSAYNQNLYQDRWPPAMLAMLGGHPELGQRIVERHGMGALGHRASSPKAYFALCSANRLRSAQREGALALSRCNMSAKDRASAANTLCIAGLIDDALAMLESTEPTEQARVARAMAAPLCAYAPLEPKRDIALIALERVVELCEGRMSPAPSPWTCVDLERLGRGSNSGREDRRVEIVSAMMSASWDWPSSRLARELSCWPRLAAFHCQNYAALALLAAFEPPRDELSSLRGCSELLLAVLDKTRKPEDLPSIWERASIASSFGASGAVVAHPKGLDPRSGAHAALSYVESKELTVVAKEGAKKADKARRQSIRSMNEAELQVVQAQSSPRPRNRL